MPTDLIPFTFKSNESAPLKMNMVTLGSSPKMFAHH